MRLCGWRTVIKGANAIGAEADPDVRQVVGERPRLENLSIHGELIGSYYHIAIPTALPENNTAISNNHNGCLA